MEGSPPPPFSATPGRAFIRGRLRLSLKTVIAGIVVAAMLLLGGLVLLLGQLGARQTVLTTTSERVQDVGRLITEQAGRMLEPAQATLQQLAFDPLTEATTLDARLKRVVVLMSALKANKLLSAIYVGDDNGDFMLARPLAIEVVRSLVTAPQGAHYLLQSVSAGAHRGEHIGEYLFYDADMRLLERREQPGYQFDARTRPWYAKAKAAQGAALSRPYVFFTTRQVGVSLSQKSHAGSSVVSVDVVLDDLAHYLADLRLTPGTEIALVGADRKVMAYPDMSRVLVQEPHEEFDFRTIDTMGVPSLSSLLALPGGNGQAQLFDIDGRGWIGLSTAFQIWSADGMRLLVAAPLSELTADLDRQQARMLQIILAVALAFLPLGWWAGKRIGQSLDQLVERAGRIGRFDFRPHGKKTAGSWVSEVHQLSKVMDGMVGTIDHFLQISQRMATETDMEQMLREVLHQFVETTRCGAGAVYLWRNEESTLVRAALQGDAHERLPARLTREQARPGRGTYEVEPGLWQIEFELRGRNGQLEGLLVLHHQDDEGHADQSFAEFAARLSGMLAVSIETRQLVEAQRKLLDAVIRLMADAIDAKSPYTGGHCERVPQLAMDMVDRMHADTEGPYRDFRMSPDDRYAFYLGAWLHDCGKVTSAEHIVDKATKLELIYNRIHEVRMRFEVLWRDAEADHLRRLLDGVPVAESLAQKGLRQAQLREDFAFVAQCNIGGEFMADENIARLQAIGEQTWERHFDDRLGLSTGELRQAEATLGAPPALLPVQERLLADRPDHVVPWGDLRPPVEKDDPRNRYGFDMQLPPSQQNMGELHNLGIRRGTLTAEDRFKINDHVVQTYVMLKNLPWPPHLQQVPHIAATHHEKMDGRGYPRRLGADQLTTFDRVMTVADIFEALTAADRPYKAAKKLSESLKIMALMCKDRHLDTELFRYFLRSGIWREFAEKNMDAAQIDFVDINFITELLPP